MEQNNDYISAGGLSHEVGILDADEGVISTYAYESNVFRRNYFTKEIYIDEDIAMECLKKAEKIYVERNKEYVVGEIISKEIKYEFLFYVVLDKPNYFESNNSHYFSISIKDFKYEYLIEDEYNEYFENLLGCIESENGKIYSDYTFNPENKTYTFKINENDYISEIKIVNPQFDYILGDKFERTIIIENS